MWYGLLAAVGFAANVLVDKFAISRQKIPQKTFIPVLFIALAVFSGLLVAVLKAPLFPGQLLASNYIIAFLAMIMLAVGWNIYYYKALARESVQEFDLLLLFEPLVTIVLASLFFASERRGPALLLSLTAVIALMVAHTKKHHVKFDREDQWLLFAILLMSLEVLVNRVLLEIFHPASLYFIRTVVLAVVFGMMYRPRISSLSSSEVMLICLSALSGVMLMVARFFGYQVGGIVLTTLVLLLGPIIVEVASLIVLRERLATRSALAFIVIILCIMYAQMFMGPAA